jgi:hypothetical protein
MSSRVDIRVALGQGRTIKAVHNVKHQTFELNKLAATQDRKEKKKKKGAGPQKSSGSDKGGAGDDETRGGAGNEEQRSYLAKKGEKEKDSQVRGGTVDIVV